MARTKGKPSISGIFKKYFADRPDLLQVSSLDEVVGMFERDHPNLGSGQKIRQVAANVKSNLKKGKKSSANGTGRRGRPPRAAAHATAGSVAGPASVATLERLESRIDDCLTIAKEIDPRGLLDVIRLLRRALSGVILKIEDR